MAKLIPIGVLIFMVAISAGIYFFRQSGSSEIIPKPLNSTSSLQQPVTSTPSAQVSLEDKVQVLEEAVIDLSKKVGASTNLNYTAGASTTTEKRLQALESAVAKLQAQQPGNSTQTVTSTGKQTPVYIPLGWSAGATTLDWSSVSSQKIDIDPADYPGYTSMQFEANLRVYQGNGTAFARITSTDGFVPGSSQVSNNTEGYAWVSSNTFTLPSGKKTYQLQLKTSTGYSSDIQNARIKINF